MSKHWLEANMARLMAEILRDFCSVSIALEEQFRRFDHAGNLSYAVLREVIGDQMNRGLLWRLKDTAHHLLRDAPGSPVAGRLLDWAIGYLFHETWKLMEDTHQHQYYAPSLLALAEGNPSPELEAVARDFTMMAMENQTEMGKKVNRIRRLLAHARLFFHRCYASQTDNQYLARFLYDREDLVREAFAGEHANLVTSIYGNTPQLLFIHAAASLQNGGKTTEALAALERAKTLAPDDPRIATAAKKFETA
ncbi:hypothetical protein LJC26_04470 [Desulfovibrio sp. OttesenSCG-928-O18]|nr:hypothetical protein [Desulfovibrio sp. OttesenSCG-928-O18]